MILAETNTNYLLKEINAFLGSARSYASTGDFWFRRLAAEAQKIMGVDPAEAHNVLANLYGVAGDYTQAIRHLDIAQKFANSTGLWANKAIILSNLGFFSEAQKAFEVAAAPQQGSFSARLELGICIGAFHKIVAFGPTALRMNLQFDIAKFELAQRAVVLMDEFSITDANLGAMLDVAGEIMRDERIFFIGQTPGILVWDQDAQEKYLAISFRLPVCGSRASALDRELGHRLFTKITDLPFQVMLNFESGLPLNERFPERTAIAS